MNRICQLFRRINNEQLWLTFSLEKLVHMHNLIFNDTLKTYLELVCARLVKITCKHSGKKKTISTPNEQNVAETTILSFERKRLLVNISMQINAYCSYHVGWDVYFFSPLDKGPWNNKKKYICKACGAARNLGQSEHIESIGQSNNKKSAHIFFSLAFSLVHCLYV